MKLEAGGYIDLSYIDTDLLYFVYFTVVLVVGTRRTTRVQYESTIIQVNKNQFGGSTGP
jgi:hypothetical protein